MKNKKPEYATPHRIMGEAVEKLRGPQREVYFLTIRDGKSLTEAAEVLGMSERLAKCYQDNAIKAVDAYCKQAIAKGRL